MKQSLKLASILLCALIVWTMNWEYQRSVGASVVLGQGLYTQDIPEEAIRLRILAHSDSPADQWLKWQIRDTIVTHMEEWLEGIETKEEAIAVIQTHLTHIEALVEQTMQKLGVKEAFEVEYGQILFPVKLYGAQLYPAGEYDGLLITLGAGQGENWWCVLFPPLCFVDFKASEAVSAVDDKQETSTMNKEASTGEEDIKVRFFLFDLFNKLKQLFV
jgi:stage II sporulation protein R